MACLPCHLFEGIASKRYHAVLSRNGDDIRRDSNSQLAKTNGATLTVRSCASGRVERCCLRPSIHCDHCVREIVSNNRIGRSGASSRGHMSVQCNWMVNLATNDTHLFTHGAECELKHIHYFVHRPCEQFAIEHIANPIGKIDDTNGTALQVLSPYGQPYRSGKVKRARTHMYANGKRIQAIAANVYLL